MHRGRLGTGVGQGLNTDEDDLYSGYNDFPSALNTDDLEYDENFQHSARTLDSRRPTALPSRGMTPGTAFGSRLGTAAGFKRESTARTGIWTRGGTGKPMTGAEGGINRPMTAVRGAGYTAAGRAHPFDPMNPASKKPTPSIEPKLEDTMEEKLKQLEEKINLLIEDSVLASCKGDHRRGLDLAKEAGNKEKSLMKLKEQAGSNEGHDWDITFSVMFNLGSQYEACEMYTEALATYGAISKNKFLIHGPKVKINMGNIYFKQGHPTKAIKMYRMAMDQLNNSHKDLRLKLMHNMGIIFLKMDHPTDAAASFEYIMQEKPSFKTGLHLIVSNFMASDSDKMKRSFQELLQVPMEYDDDEEKYSSISDDPVSQLLMEVLKNDKLRKLEKERKLYGERCVLSAARLIAPAIESTLTEGYNWVTEEIKSSKHSQLAHALEISKALVFLKQRELSEAAEILKSFEKKETKVATAAATNLSFMFFLQGELEQAEKYGSMATKADFYNSVAYVNLGNCHFVRGDYDEAKKCYTEAMGIDSSCIEALYNLGLVNQNLKFFEEALECFHKVQSLVRNHPHVTYELGRTHELRGEHEIAMEWYLKALALVPTDPGILKKLGELSDIDGDRQGAYQHYYDCYKYDPSDMFVIEWLASYLQEMQLPEKALNFYQKAQMLQPEDPKWTMLMGHAFRRMGNYSQALQTFTKVYKDNPENIQALNSLVRLSTDMGLKEADGYREELAKLERVQESRLNSSRSRGSAPATRFGPPSRMGSSRVGQRNNQHQQSNSASFDDNRSISDGNSEYGQYSDGPVRVGNRDGSDYRDSGEGSSGLLRNEGLFDYEEDDRVDELDLPMGNRNSGMRRPETRGRGRPKTASVEELEAFFAANEVNSDILPI